MKRIFKWVVTITSQRKRARLLIVFSSNVAMERICIVMLPECVVLWTCEPALEIPFQTCFNLPIFIFLNNSFFLLNKKC